MKNKGITLVALIITIIILLILAGITISQLSANGILSKVTQAKQEYENAQEREDATLDNYIKEIGEVTGSRDETTIESLERRIEALENRNKKDTLWTGAISSGTMTLSKSVYDYDYLIFVSGHDGASAITQITSTTTQLRGGGGARSIGSNNCSYWGFCVSSISSDGKTLTLAGSGYGNSSSNWNGSKDIIQIDGVKY